MSATLDPGSSLFFEAYYNADGLRTSKNDTRAGVLQHNDFSWSPLGLLWSSNPNTVYTPGFGHRSNGVNSFYQTDWLSSTRYVTDITGSTTLAAQSYDAWGNVDAQAPGSPNHPGDLMFAGGWGYQTEWSNGAAEPGVGLLYLQQRYYDPVLGRFISPDPLGYAAGTNLYEYADDDPANGVDPLGLCLHHERSWWDTLKGLWDRWQDTLQAQAVQNYIAEQASLGRNVLGDSFSDDPFLTKQMQKAFNSQKTVEEYDDLVEKFERGILSPGKGNGTLGNGVIYLRGVDGTRIFIRKIEGNVFEVLGIADKSNETAVINYLRRLYRLR